MATKKQPPVTFDEDNPEWTAEDFARARPVSELPPHIAAAFPNTVKARGRPVGSVKEDAKERITIRLDRDVVEKFRATGAGWQSRVNEALRKVQV
ncbi:MAG: BrnA antitoxin family protein [Sphingobium sp.]